VLTIDGSYGEGGGQIVRTAVALSVLTKTPIKIMNIRAKRPVPGLRPQHHTTVTCIQSMCGGTTSGLTVGSSSLEFTPGEIKPGSYTFDIGTAGSITLVFQACILSALKTTKPITLTLKGGTDVRWAPSWDYFANIFLPLLDKMGVHTEVQLKQRGYYPTGGGEAQLTIHPSPTLQPFSVIEPPSVQEIHGLIHIANLPDHISTRMKHAVMKIAVTHNLTASIRVEPSVSSSPGTGITLWSSSPETILGAAALGDKQVTAEQVGIQAIHQLLQELQHETTIDRYALDQLLPYLALAPAPSGCLIREISSHAQTTMWLLKQFFKKSFTITTQPDNLKLSIH